MREFRLLSKRLNSWQSTLYKFKKKKKKTYFVILMIWIATQVLCFARNDGNTAYTTDFCYTANICHT
ncbi:hypothetical protein [Helicobacter sp. T3_23-1056]